MTASLETIKEAETHLIKHDPILSKIIKRYGPCTIRPHKNYYQELVESIIGQQLSVKAGSAIRQRFTQSFAGSFPAPAAILNKSIEELRSVGLSRAKATYIQDLASHILEKKIILEKLDDLSNEEVIKELTTVKGIGEWTAHMFMMFCMGRLDILAHGDLGIRNGVKNLYSLKELPTPDDIKAVATKNSWHPFETVACWYVWQSLDNNPS